MAVEGLCDVAEGGSCIAKEYFAEGTVPTESCSCHVKCNICTASNRLAGEHCPIDKIITKVYLVKQEKTATDDKPLILPTNLNGKQCALHN